MNPAPAQRKLFSVIRDGLTAVLITIVFVACLPLLGAIALGMRPLVLLALLVVLLGLGLSEAGLRPGRRARAGHPRH